MTSRNDVHCAAARAARNARSMEGTKWQTVTPFDRARVRYEVSRCPPGNAISSVAPVMSGQNNSHTETSKLNGVFWSTTSLEASLYSDCIHSRRLTIPRCALTAPFGFPVEPDV